jgi:Uma2 family endonuclease
MTTPEIAGRVLTYEDLPDWELDGLRHELIAGEHIAEPSPIPRHQFIAGNLFRLLGTWIHERDHGRLLTSPIDVVFSPTDVVGPDLLFIARGRLDIIGAKYIAGAPDLAVEILSPSSRRRDEVVKRRLYEREGVGEYWVVDPVRETVRVYRLVEGGYRRADELSAAAGDVLTSPLFPGLAIPLAEIFE